MKIQRTLAILWLASFIALLCYWLWEFVEKWAPAYDGIHAWLSLLCLFGAIASIFLFQGAKWARISIGIIALFFAVGVLWDICQQGWMWRDKWADNGLCFFSLVSVVFLFFPRHEPVA
jgi:hypothetical protein